MEYTKYEKARIIGARALQLSMGAPFILKLSKRDIKRMRYSTIEIAKLEFEKGVIPINVRRPVRTAPIEERSDEKSIVQIDNQVEEYDKI